MRLFIVIASMLGLCAQASATVSAKSHTCAELKSMVRAQGAVTIQDSNGAVTVYANQMECYYNGMSSKFEAVQAKDKACVVGLVCTSPNGAN